MKYTLLFLNYFYFFFFFFIDTETLQDSSASAQSSLQIETVTDKDSSIMGMSPSNGNGQQVPIIGDKSDDVNDTSELLGFNLSLFPTASIFGANPMFQKLQGK